MMKSICVLARREDLTREAFHDYYETRHAPLGIEHFPFDGYVRNHLLGDPDIGFDTISEFWARDIVALAGLMEGPVGDILRADERRFMDQSRVAPAGVEEHVLSPGVTDGERYAILLSGEIDSAALLQWAGSIARQVPGISLDFTTSWTDRAFPANAVLWTPDAAAVDRIPRGLDARTLRVKRVSTSAATLAAARRQPESR